MRLITKGQIFGAGRSTSPLHAGVAGAFAMIFLLTTAVAQNYPSTLSAEERLYGLSQVWYQLTTKFAAPESHVAPDTDSLYKEYIPRVILSPNDLSYYRTLQQFAAVFSDANTYVEMPRSLRDSLVRPPVIIREVRGRFYITNVARSLADRIPIGSEVQRINGFEVHSYLLSEVLPFIPAGTPHGRMAKATAALLDGWIKTRVMLNCLTPDGRTINEAITREVTHNTQWSNPLPPSQSVDIAPFNREITVITINRWSNDLNLLSTHRHLSKATGIILDLRNFNQPVPFSEIVPLAIQFSDVNRIALPGFALRAYPYTFLHLGNGLQQTGKPGKVSGYRFILPDTLTVTPEITPENRFSQPLMILTGPETGNGAEHFLMMIRQNPFRATIIGEQTAGATGASLNTPLPGGGTLHVKARYDIYPHDSWIEFGFHPDVTIPADIKSILNGEDLPMLKAIEILQGL